MSHNSNHYEDREGLHPLSEQYCSPSWPSAAKLLVMSDFVRPHRQQPTRLCCPWESPGKNTGVGCHFLLQCMKVKSESEVAQSCLTHCNSMDCSPPGSSVHGIFQARVLEWGATAFSTSWPTSPQILSTSPSHSLATTLPDFF